MGRGLQVAPTFDENNRVRRGPVSALLPYRQDPWSLIRDGAGVSRESTNSDTPSPENGDRSQRHYMKWVDSTHPFHPPPQKVLCGTSYKHQSRRRYSALRPLFHGSLNHHQKGVYAHVPPPILEYPV